MKQETCDRLKKKRSEKAARIRQLRRDFITINLDDRNKTIRIIAEQEFGEIARPTPPCLGDYLNVEVFEHGLRAFHGDYESWARVWLLDGDWDDERIMHELGVIDHYGGPGRRFSGAPFVQRNGHSTLVYQRGGLDI